MIDDTILGFSYSSLMNHSLDFQSLINSISNTANQYKFSVDDKRVHKFVKSYIYQEKLITIKYFKTIGAWFVPDICISLHLSQFKSFNEFKIWFKELTGEHYSFLMTEAEIYRLDCCFETLDFNLDYIYQNVYRRYVSIPTFKLYGDFNEI